MLKILDATIIICKYRLILIIIVLIFEFFLDLYKERLLIYLYIGN